MEIAVNEKGCTVTLYSATGRIGTFKSPLVYRPDKKYSIIEAYVVCPDKRYAKVYISESAIKVQPGAMTKVVCEKLGGKSIDVYARVGNYNVYVGTLTSEGDQLYVDIVKLLQKVGLGVTSGSIQIYGIVKHDDADLYTNPVTVPLPSGNEIDIDTGKYRVAYLVDSNSLVATKSEGRQEIVNKTGVAYLMELSGDGRNFVKVQIPPGTHQTQFLAVKSNNLVLTPASPLLLGQKARTVGECLPGGKLTVALSNDKGVVAQKQVDDDSDVSVAVKEMVETLWGKDLGPVLGLSLCTPYKCTQPKPLDCDPWGEELCWDRKVYYIRFDPVNGVSSSTDLLSKVVGQFPTFVFDGLREGIVYMKGLTGGKSTLLVNGKPVSPGVVYAPPGSPIQPQSPEAYTWLVFRGADSEGNVLYKVIELQGNATLIPAYRDATAQYRLVGAAVITRDENGIYSSYVIRPAYRLESFTVDGNVVTVSLDTEPVGRLKLCNEDECKDIKGKAAQLTFSKPVTRLYFLSDYPVLYGDKPFSYCWLDDVKLSSVSLPYVVLSVKNGEGKVSVYARVVSLGVERLVYAGDVYLKEGSVQVDITKALASAEKLLGLILVSGGCSMSIDVGSVDVARPELIADKNGLRVVGGFWESIATPVVFDCSGAKKISWGYINLLLLDISCGSTPMLAVQLQDGTLVPFKGNKLTERLDVFSPKTYYSVSQRKVTVVVTIPTQLAPFIGRIYVRDILSGKVVSSNSDPGSIASGSVTLVFRAVPSRYTVFASLRLGDKQKEVPIGAVTVLPRPKVVGDVVCFDDVDTSTATVSYMPPEGEPVVDRESTSQLATKGCFKVSKVGKYIVSFGVYRIPIIVFGISRVGDRVIVYDVYQHEVKCKIGCEGGGKSNYLELQVNPAAPVVQVEVDGATKTFTNPYGTALISVLSTGLSFALGALLSRGSK